MEAAIERVVAGVGKFPPTCQVIPCSVPVLCNKLNPRSQKSPPDPDFEHLASMLRHKVDRTPSALATEQTRLQALTHPGRKRLHLSSGPSGAVRLSGRAKTRIQTYLRSLPPLTTLPSLPHSSSVLL